MNALHRFFTEEIPADEIVKVTQQANAELNTMQARIEKLEAGLRRIVNGEYDNARTILAAEKFARELLRGDQ